MSPIRDDTGRIIAPPQLELPARAPGPWDTNTAPPLPARERCAVCGWKHPDDACPYEFGKD